MNENLGRHLGNIEIADLIEESVANATERRQQFIKDSLVDIPEEEAKNIQGGKITIPFPDPNTCTPELCIIGIIITIDPELLKKPVI